MSSKRILLGAGLLVVAGLLLSCAAPVTTGTPLPLVPSETPTAAGAVESPTAAVGAAGTATPLVVVSPTPAAGGGPGAVQTTMTPGATPCTAMPDNSN